MKARGREGAAPQLCFTAPEASPLHGAPMCYPGPRTQVLMQLSVFLNWVSHLISPTTLPYPSYAKLLNINQSVK